MRGGQPPSARYIESLTCADNDFSEAKGKRILIDAH